jgi:hypothetical protein
VRGAGRFANDPRSPTWGESSKIRRKTPAGNAGAVPTDTSRTLTKPLERPPRHLKLRQRYCNLQLSVQAETFSTGNS